MHQETGNKQTFEQVLHDSDAYLSAQIAELSELLKLCLDRVARLEEENRRLTLLVQQREEK